MQTKKMIFGLLTSKELLNICKANVAFLLAMTFLWLPHFRNLFPGSSIGVYSQIALVAIALHSGQTVGAYFDAFVLGILGIAGGGFLALLIPYISQQSLAVMIILTFIGFFIFLFFRTLGPRFLGVSIFGPLLISISVISQIASTSYLATGSYPISPQPLFYNTIVGFCIGTVISMVVCFAVLPQFAHQDFRLFLKSWADDLSTFLSLVMEYYTEGKHLNRDEVQKQMNDLVVSFRSRLGSMPILLNAVQAEPFCSNMTFKVLMPIALRMKSLTEAAMFMHSSCMDCRNWFESSGLKPIPQDLHVSIHKVSRNVMEDLQSILSEISLYLMDPSTAIGDNLDHKDAFGADESVVDKEKQLIQNVVQFEYLLRTVLDHLYIKLSQNNPDWANQNELILTIYHFSLALEEATKKVLDLKEFIKNSASKKQFYWPFMKWAPLKYGKSILNCINPASYQRDGKFSFAVWYASIIKFLIVNVWSLKTALVMILYMVLFFEPTARTFYNQYGLSGGLITLIIVLTPSVGGSFLAVIFQLAGNVTGNLFALAFFYAFGDNPWLLWIPCILIGFPGYFILVKYPQFTSIGLLLLLGFSGIMVSCWNQQFLPDSRKTEYWLLSCKAIVSLCLGLGFGTIFNLIIFPKFAKVEVVSELSKAIEQVESIYLGAIDLPSNFSKNELASPVPGAREFALDDSKIEIARLEVLVQQVQSRLLQMRFLLIQAEVEPELENKFHSEKYLRVISKLEGIVNSLRGTVLALKVPWFASNVMSSLWDEQLTGKRDHLVSTMLVLYRLYSGSVSRHRTLPPSRPKAMQIRAKVTYHLLSEHLSFSLRNSQITKSASETTIVPMEDHEQSTSIWNEARSSLNVGDDSPNRKFGVGTLFDVYYYSFIAWMRTVVQGTDELGDLLDDIYRSEQSENP